MSKRTAFSAACAGAVLLAAAGATAQTYSIGTNPQGSLFYASGTALARVMVEQTGLQFRVQPYAGSSTYLPLIDAGKLAFGMANVAEASFAYAGEHLFKTPLRNVRQVAETFGNVSGYAVRKDSSIRTIADLRGQRVPVEYTSGRIFHFVASAALATADMTDRDLEGVPSPNFVSAAKLFMAGRVDAAYLPVSAGITKQANATIRGGIRFLKMGCEAADEARIKTIVPPAFIGKLSPGKTQTGIVEDPTCVIDVPFTLVAGKHVPDEIVRKVVVTMVRNKPALAKAMAAFNRMDTKNLGRKHPNPHHPGAIKAYKELGLWKD
ncbi:MAG: TAXI family TRAP transporter solute-binding subunit [Alphaproteobacteria bacterium]|nr:TAXI family TRAP transporter solute-binding subunit [Alphaproteobacteria bacterium]